MKDSVFYDSIGLNNDNRSSAVDLSYLITGASEYALIRELSTTPEASFRIGKREVISSTTNRLIKDEDWDIELQKTGLTTAGRLLHGHAGARRRKECCIHLPRLSE